MKVIIACDIYKENEKYKKQAYELYEILENSGVAQPYFYCDNFKIFRKKPYYDYKNIEDLSSVENSLIILMSEINEYFNIDNSNKIAYFNDGFKIDKFAIFMLNRIDCILADSYKSAISLCNDSSRFNVEIPIYRFPIKVEEGKFKNINSDVTSIAMFGNNEKTEQSLSLRNEFKLINISNIDEVMGSKIVIVESDISTNYLRNLIDNEIVVIAPNKLPYTEYITDGFNGFLVSSNAEFEKAIELCSRDLNKYVDNIRLYNKSSRNNREFANNLINTIHGNGNENLRDHFKFNKMPKDMKKFIIRDQVMGDGNIVPFPPLFRQDIYKELSAHNLVELLEFLANVEFDEVVVFSNNMDMDMDKLEYIEKLSSAIGRRAINVFWCCKEDLDKRLNKAFKYINVMKTSQGIKRVIV